MSFHVGKTRLGAEMEIDFLDGAGEAVRDFAAVDLVAGVELVCFTEERLDVLLLFEVEVELGCLFNTDVNGDRSKVGVLVTESRPPLASE